ncbi:ABC transporter permease [Komagataeibacter sp. FNDCR2]|uniref:cell division protein FtsL n=1 Tax=Komagataeibacter sp. FNDCR2 TaxID=2878682 RepID=UPI001E6009F4|nr:ABC transporter permease [Komagataeibacter sp. FNDCR2]MCE2574749.1 ABC transporter permease [Komagataeibacter sp. FNDCR2]
MSRFVTLFCAIVAAVSGLFLYNKKQQTTALDHQIAQIVEQTERTRSQTAMLRAEWAMLNQPDRLSALASRYDKPLQSVMPAQFVQMSALVTHLPAIGSAPSHPAPAPRAAMVATLAADHVPAPAPDTTATSQPTRVAAAPFAIAPAPRAEHAVMAVHHEAPPARALAQNESRVPPVHATPAEHVRPPERVATAEPAPPAPLRDTIVPPAASYHARTPGIAEAAWRPAVSHMGTTSLGTPHIGALPPPVPVSN